MRRAAASSVFRARCLCIVTLFSITACGWTAVANATQGSLFTVVEENDFVVGTDRHYTQGIRFVYLSKDNQPACFAEAFGHVWSPGMDVEAHKFRRAVGRHIDTPKDKRTKALVKRDHPYAGWLYIGGTCQRRDTMRTLATLDHAELGLGVMGPESLAEEFPIRVHETRGFRLPKGWDNQLDTEAGIGLKLQRQWRFSVGRCDFFAVDFIPSGRQSRERPPLWQRRRGSADGLRHAQLFRRADPSLAFIQQRGRSLRRAELLRWVSVCRCRGTGSRLHGVSKETLVGDVLFGGVMVFTCCDMADTQTFRSKEFKHQKDENSFGSVSVIVKF